MNAIDLRVKCKWKKLDPDTLMQAVGKESATAVQNARALARSILIRNVGTQYFSLHQLRAMGHPYSHYGFGRPGGVPAGIINRQSGGFYSSFYVRLTYTGTRYSMVVGQTGPELAQGNWLQEGTARMRGRPWREHLRSEIIRVVKPYLAKTLNERLKLTVHAFGVNYHPRG